MKKDLFFARVYHMDMPTKEPLFGIMYNSLEDIPRLLKGCGLPEEGAIIMITDRLSIACLDYNSEGFKWILKNENTHTIKVCDKLTDNLLEQDYDNIC